jgi:hypothetical protein
LSRRGHRCRPAGRGGGSPRPTVGQTCKCSTYVFWTHLFFLTFVPVVRHRMSTLAKLPARERASLPAVLGMRPPRPQSSQQLQSRLGAPRGSQARRRLQQAARPGLERLPQLTPQRREDLRPLLLPGGVKSPRRPEQEPLRLRAPQVWSKGQ